MTDENIVERPWSPPEPGRLMGRGHSAGDFLEAWSWEVLEDGDGYLKVLAHLPDRARNPSGNLFGGFTPTYVDLIALHTTRRRAGGHAQAPRLRLVTTSMHVDYLRPVTGPKFVIESHRETHHGRTHVVVTRFLQDGELAVLATTTLRERASRSSGGDS